MVMSVRPPRVRDYVSRSEAAALVEASDLRAAWEVTANLGVIAMAFALVGLWPHPLTFVAAAFVLAGRYIGLGILTHDAAHNALFRSRRVNTLLGRWVFAAPTLIDFDTYQRGHLSHHRHAGTREDPDLPFVRAYPVPTASMRRKILRDVTGRTGLRDGLYLVLMTLRHRRPAPIVAHAALFGALWFLQMPWAYAAWWVGFLFVVPLCLRLRVMGEHGSVPDLLDRDARQHARTTKASWVARALIAPHHVNFHCEHHFFPTVPGYSLPRLHQLLTERGFYEAHPHAVASNYREVVRECIGERPDRPDLGDIGRGQASLANMA